MRGEVVAAIADALREHASLEDDLRSRVGADAIDRLIERGVDLHQLALVQGQRLDCARRRAHDAGDADLVALLAVL